MKVIERRIRIAISGTAEEQEKLKQLEKQEKLVWAKKVGIASHKLYLKMNFGSRLLQLEAEEILIQQLAVSPFKKWLKLSDKQKQNHWFTKHVWEPESKEEFEALMEKTKANSRFGRLVIVFEKWLEMTPAFVDALKLSLAVVLSAKVKDDVPLWLDLVGVSGAGKTKLLTSLAEIDCVVLKSRITPAALVSGDGRLKKDPSLLPKLRGKCLIWKDFTEVLNMKQDEKSKIYDILRGAYDGILSADFGTGVFRNYKDIYFSMIAGVTNAAYLDDTAALGERRIKYKLPKTELHTQKTKMRKALSTSEFSEEGVIELQAACVKFMDGCSVLTLPTLPKSIKERLISFALTVGILRTHVDREKYDSLHRITLNPESEEAMRLVKQLKKLGQMLSIIMDEKEITEEIFDLLLKVGFSTPHPHRVNVFEAMHSMDGEGMTKQTIMEKTGIASTTLNRTLDDMKAIGIVKREKGGRRKGAVGGQTPDRWCLADEIKKLWSEV